MPFPTMAVVPAGWSRHHAPAAAGGMNATVTIGVPTGPPTYDPGTDNTTQPYSADYTGPARVQALNDTNTADAAGQNTVGRSYLVQLNMNVEDADTADIVPGARCKVTSAVNDARMVGQDLWVTDVQYGSERFTRDLVCSDNQTDAPSTT